MVDDDNPKDPRFFLKGTCTVPGIDLLKFIPI